nr:uncharacterized protein LOC112040715 [Quercus suber]
MRWFDSMKADSISSFKELTQAFGLRFVTCRRMSRPLSSLLSLSMQKGETLKAYSDRYWEMFNDMEGNFDAMALDTFKLGLHTDHGLRTSLFGKPVTSMRQLMDRIKKTMDIPQMIAEACGTTWTNWSGMQLKDYLARPQIMSSPKSNEVLFAYIAVAPYAVSLVLIRADCGVQRPVYYAHTVIVLTQLPFKAVLQSVVYTGRIAKWGIILGAFDIKYMPRMSVKGQILADLVAEFTKPHLEEAIPTSDMDEKSVGMISQQSPSYWEMYVDGAVNQKGSGVGLVLISPEKIVIEKSLRLNFTATNNEAEYEALLTRMAMIRRMGGKSLEAFSDSRLVVGQVQGEFEVKDERMQGYLSRVKRLRSGFDFFNLLHIPRNGNAHADSLATFATSSVQNLPRVILVEDLQGPTEAGTEAVQVHQIRAEPSWMDHIINFLQGDVLPKEKGEADKVRRKATRFWLSEDQRLYKRSYSGLYLLCIHPEAAELLLEELHERIFGSYTGGGTLNPLFGPWPFAQWGLDIVGPFSKAAGNRKYLLVGTDYFTKWVEAEPLANIRDADAQKFVWKNIITRFGVPHTLISDNGLQFDSKAFISYCNELGITNRYSTPTYPQGNGQAEAVN